LNAFTNSFKTIGTGSITDGVFKLEIQIIEYEHDNTYKKSDYIEIKRYVKISSKYPKNYFYKFDNTSTSSNCIMNALDDIFHIEVQKLSDIKLIGNKMLSFAQLLLGSKLTLKRTVSESIFYYIIQDHRARLFVIKF